MPETIISHTEASLILSTLQGQQLAWWSRVGGMLVLALGELISRISTSRRTRGQVESVNTYFLHIQAPWRITQNNCVLAGQDDILMADGDGDLTMFDRRLEELYSSHLQCARVETVEVTAFGGLLVRLDKNIHVEAVVMNSSRSHDAEYWRFFVADQLDSHVVAAGDGTWADLSAWIGKVEKGVD